MSLWLTPEASWETCTSLTSGVSHGHLVVVMVTSLIHDRKQIESQDGFVIWLPVSMSFLTFQCVTKCLCLPENGLKQWLIKSLVRLQSLDFRYYPLWLWFKEVSSWGLNFYLNAWDERVHCNVKTYCIFFILPLH